MAITGAALGLPGTEHIFGDDNVARILRGDQFITLIPERFRHAMLDKNITRLVKDESGSANFETIHEMEDAIKLAGRGGAFDPENEFGISAERLAALEQRHQTGDRRRHRCPARCRHTLGDALQEDEHRNRVAGPLGTS